MSPDQGGRGRFRRLALRIEARRLAEELERLSEGLRLLNGSMAGSAPISTKASYLRALDAQQRARAALDDEGTQDVGAARDAIAEGQRALEEVRSRLALRTGGKRPHDPDPLGQAEGAAQAASTPRRKPIR